jgi:hypothetical protein
LLAERQERAILVSTKLWPGESVKGEKMSELSIHELEAEIGEVLPERETLGTINSHVNIDAFNLALAVDYKTLLSHNSASSTQNIHVSV